MLGSLRYELEFWEIERKALSQVLAEGVPAFGKLLSTCPIKKITAKRALGP